MSERILKMSVGITFNREILDRSGQHKVGSSKMHLTLRYAMHGVSPALKFAP